MGAYMPCMGGYGLGFGGAYPFGGGYGMGFPYGGFGGFGYGGWGYGGFLGSPFGFPTMLMPPTPPLLPQCTGGPFHDSFWNDAQGDLHEKIPFFSAPRGWENRSLPEQPGYYGVGLWA